MTQYRVTTNYTVPRRLLPPKKCTDIRTVTAATTREIHIKMRWIIEGLQADNPGAVMRGCNAHPL